MGRVLPRLATYIMTRAHPVKAHLPAGRRLGWRKPGDFPASTWRGHGAGAGAVAYMGGGVVGQFE